MKNEYLVSEEAKEMLAELSEKMDELLVEGRTYHSEVNIDEHGSSRDGIYFYENGVLHDFNNFGKYAKEEIREHIESINRFNFIKLLTFFPVYSKIKFTFKKGELIQAEKFSIPMLLESVKSKVIKRLMLFVDNDQVLHKAEVLLHFKKEGNEIGMFVDSTYYYDNKISSYDDTANKEDILSIYHQLDGKIETLYFICENDTIQAQSYPAFEEHGLQLLTVSQIESDPEYKKRKEASEECKKLRNDFFSSLGKPDEHIIYLSLGGLGDHSWPEDSTLHNSCKMRVIYTPESTVLMTDGLSDIYRYSDDDEHLEHNGIGAEFYMEFHSTVPYEIIHKHFAVALINSVSQMAIGHGDFKSLMENLRVTFVEFSEENIELWVTSENNPNQDLSSFLVSEDFIEDESFGVLLGIESKTVPQKLQLNLEEILLISIKPVVKKWLSKDQLRSDNNEEAKQHIIKEFKDSGSWNLVPLTYHSK